MKNKKKKQKSKKRFADTEELKKIYKGYKRKNLNYEIFRWVLLIVWLIMILVIGCYLWHENGHKLPEGTEILSWTPLFTLPSLPLLWGMRILSNNITEATILRQEYFAREHLLDNIYRWCPEAGEKRDEYLHQYADSWYNNSPADKMLQLNQKNPSSEKIIDKIINNVQKSTSKE